MLKRTILLVILLSPLASISQIKQTEIGQWREHVPYHKANSVAVNGNIIYGGSAAGFVAFNMANGEVKRYTTITGLSDIGIIMLKFNDATKSLVVAYKNGNLDILKGNKITNLPVIKNANIIADKTINNIQIDGIYAYISTGFGIVVLNMEKVEIKDTYLLGQNNEPLNVNDVYAHHDANLIYAATDQGVMTAKLSDNLSDYNSWSKATFMPDPSGAYNHLDFYDGKVIVNYLTQTLDSDIVYTIQGNVVEVLASASGSGTNDFNVYDGKLLISKYYNILVYRESLLDFSLIYEYESGGAVCLPSMALLYKNFIWVADQTRGLVQLFETDNFVSVAPNGPNTLKINDMDIKKDVLWTTSGILDPDYRSATSIPEFNTFKDQTWTGIDRDNESKLDSVYGYVKIVVNPYNPKQVFAGSWDNGLMEFRDGKVYQSYNASNKAQLNHSLSPIQGTKSIRVGGMAYDGAQNLWISNSETPFALNVLKADGTWKNFNLSSYVDISTIVGEVLIASNGYIWIVLNRAATNNRILVYDPGSDIDNTFDDRVIALSTDAGRGSIPGSTVHCITQDKNGAIWVGTNEGPAVFYSPSLVFDVQQDAQRIFVQQDGQTQILLETEDIKGITVDGANRKWFASSNSGAYLMSDDASKEINHFTSANSPLFSDEVNDIEINGNTGEVYFCTSEGLISYKGTATEGASSFSTVEVFPNPVDRNYAGPVAIKGLAENSVVKITDVNGVLVYESRAFGGQAIWDGNSIKGSKVKNGVYLIFCTDEKGESQEVSKLLYLNN